MKIICLECQKEYFVKKHPDKDYAGCCKSCWNNFERKFEKENPGVDIYKVYFHESYFGIHPKFGKFQQVKAKDYEVCILGVNDYRVCLYSH